MSILSHSVPRHASGYEHTLRDYFPTKRNLARAAAVAGLALTALIGLHSVQETLTAPPAAAAYQHGKDGLTEDQLHAFEGDTLTGAIDDYTALTMGIGAASVAALAGIGAVAKRFSQDNFPQAEPILTDETASYLTV